MGTVLGQVIPLAIGAAFSPLAFGVVVATLAGPRPLTRGAAVVVGAALPLVAVGAAVLVFGNAISLPKSKATDVVDIVLGVALLLLGLRALLHPSGSGGAHHREPGGSAARSLALGFAAGATNVSTLALFVPAMKEISVADLDAEETALATVLVLVITLAMLWIPVALTAIAPRASGRVLSAVGAWLESHRRAIPVALGFGFGAYLVLKGISGL